MDGAVAEYQAGAAAGGGGGSRGDRQRASESAANEVLDNVVGGVVGGARDLSSFSSDDDNDARTMAGLLSQAQDKPPIFERSGPSSQAPPAWAQGGTGSGGPRVQEPEARNAAPRRHLLVSHYLARALDNARTAKANSMASTFLAATHICLQVASGLAAPKSSAASAASALHIPRATKSSVSAPPDEPWRNLDLVLITGIILGARGDRY